MIESFLRKIVKNENPEYKDGMKKLIFKEHLACILGIAIVSLALGMIVDFFSFSSFNFVKSLGSASAIFMFSGVAFTFIFLPISFFKILGQRRVNAIIIYEIWLAMSFVFTIFIVIKRIGLI